MCKVYHFKGKIMNLGGILHHKAINKRKNKVKSKFKSKSEQIKIENNCTPIKNYVG